MIMGDGFGGLTEGALQMFMSVVQRVLSALFSAFSSIFAGILKPHKNIKKDADQADFRAKHPPANIDVTSHERRGVVFGKQFNRYIIKPEEMDGHILVVGGTGTGKSSCVAIPTLRSWKESVFAVDIKGELYEKTKQHRQNVKVFNPQDPNSPYVYDPYFFLKNSENPAQEALAIAQAILPISHDAREPFWIENAQNILAGTILHYRYMKKSFIDTLKNIQSQKPADLIKLVAESPDEKARLYVKPFVDTDSRMLAGISAEISRGITALVTDDAIIRALTLEKGKEIISPADLENGQDIYIKIPEHLLRQWKNLLTLMVNQFITFFEKRGENEFNRPILFLLDEFPRLGKIPAITDVLPTLRSKKITICLIIQSLAQLEQIYGHNARKVIADSCAFKAVLGATDADTQEYFSKLVGTYEKIRATQSQNKNQYGAPSGSGASFAEDNEKRIIKPEEFAYLRDIILLYPLPHNFCRVQKQPYYVAER